MTSRTAANGHDDLIAAAEALAPLLREKARDAESARRPLDEVIEATRETGLFSLMVPECFGGHEADLDTFFEVVLRLSSADTSMGWLLGFYIEHCYWMCGFDSAFQDVLFDGRDHVLAPAALNVTGGKATAVDDGYQLDGVWQWGTGIVHAEWVLAGALATDAGGSTVPMFFALPADDVEAIDTWHMAGMCGTGSWDMKISDIFVPAERAVSMLDLVNGAGEGLARHEGPLYQTPLMAILAFAAGTPMLGAARLALDEYLEQTRRKIDSGVPGVGGEERTVGKPAVVAQAALSIDAAESVFREVLADVMAQRNAASIETRSTWQARITHAVLMCREAVHDIASVIGASGSRLDNPIQRALRDVSTATNHVVFDRESRYTDHGRLLLGQPLKNLMV